MTESSEAAPNEPVFTLKTLRRVSILKDLDDKEISELDEKCQWQEYQPDQQILSYEDVGSEVFFVVRGGVRIVQHLQSGGQVGVANCEAGGLFGELAAIDGAPRSMSVYASQRSIVGVMDRSTFIDLLKGSNEVSLRLLVHLVKIIRETNQRIVDVDNLSEVQQVYFALLRLAEPNPEDGGWYIYQMPRHRELAERLNTTPEVVAHAVSQLMKEELVKRRASSLQLLDKTKIQKLALM